MAQVIHNPAHNSKLHFSCSYRKSLVIIEHGNVGLFDRGNSTRAFRDGRGNDQKVLRWESGQCYTQKVFLGCIQTGKESAYERYMHLPMNVVACLYLERFEGAEQYARTAVTQNWDPAVESSS